MNLNTPEILEKLSEWQGELRQMTGNSHVTIRVYEDPQYSKSIGDIIEIVCEETGVDKQVMPKKTRKREVVITRQLIAYYAKMCTHLSLKEIGSILGGRDHTTAIHSIQTVKDLLDSGNLAMCCAVANINLRLDINGQSSHPNNSHAV
jgi:chromosomal replication initiation ATPase DnaA